MTAEDQYEHRLQVVLVNEASYSLKKYVWLEQHFQPKELNILEPSYIPNDTEKYLKVDYLKQYFDEELYTIFIEKTNQTSVQKTGHSSKLTIQELQMYFAINLVMASIDYPVLRMYWASRWRISIVAY